MTKTHVMAVMADRYGDTIASTIVHERQQLQETVGALSYQTSRTLARDFHARTLGLLDLASHLGFTREEMENVRRMALDRPWPYRSTGDSVYSYPMTSKEREWYEQNPNLDHFHWDRAK